MQLLPPQSLKFLFMGVGSNEGYGSGMHPTLTYVWGLDVELSRQILRNQAVFALTHLLQQLPQKTRKKASAMAETCLVQRILLRAKQRL